MKFSVDTDYGKRDVYAGEPFVCDGKYYAVCAACHKIVAVTGVFGTLHSCVRHPAW